VELINLSHGVVALSQVPEEKLAVNTYTAEDAV
jgi:hypothetical protein